MLLKTLVVSALTGSSLAMPLLGLLFRSANPFQAPYTYLGAKNGAPGSGQGGILVPMAGDSPHAFQAPGPGDLRGPCPGLNAAANHNFISHDGITTWTEMVDMLQNVYNMGYDLSVFLATLGVAINGDTVTGKMSIGADATSRTALLGLGLLGNEPGLNGHNKFEGDSSLTRNDYFLVKSADNYSLNTTLFGYMADMCGDNFDMNCLSKFRKARYQQSIADNGNFYFGPRALFLYGAASFLYELFADYGIDGQPSLVTMSSFFGAKKVNGVWTKVPEQFPANWHNKRTPYGLLDVTGEIFKMYSSNPVLFGGNTGRNNFNTINWSKIQNGTLSVAIQPSDILCLLYQLATENVPGSLSDVLALPLDLLSWVLGKINPIFQNLGCPLKV